MVRQFTESKIVIASHNAGKVSEIADLLEPLGVSVISAGEAGLPEPEETGKTFIENAELKAKAAALAFPRFGMGVPNTLRVRSRCRCLALAATMFRFVLSPGPLWRSHPRPPAATSSSTPPIAPCRFNGWSPPVIGVWSADILQ